MMLRYRQVHLDFHTAGTISGVGSKFNKNKFQEMLRKAAVDSITCFSVCHHGWSYHPTQIGKMHPSLESDLLRTQLDAAHEVDIAVPVYISAGGNDVAALEHPEWREVNPPGVQGWSGADANMPGFKKLCFNTEYLDYLCELIGEAVARYPDVDGIFLDIVIQNQCICPKCVADMHKAGFDSKNEADRKEFSSQVLLNYYERTNAAAKKYDPAMKIYHNSGHVDSGRPELIKYFSHLELESLPTGGWGYDHFPLSAAFARTTDKEFLGMTGKFHSTWGEFGGFKEPNALRYECCAMLAYGARCSVGDQLHPCGRLDASTYELIGRAYREVRYKEQFCVNAVNVSEIGLITAASTGSDSHDGDVGVSRILLEGHLLFDAPLLSVDWSCYKMLVISDGVVVSDVLKSKIKKYLANGGKVVAAAKLWLELGLDCGAIIHANGELSPTYVLPEAEFRPDFLTTPFVMYGQSVELTPDENARSIGQVYYPYFNRTREQFCSHQHTPNQLEPQNYSAGVISGNTAVFAQDVFATYRDNGSALLRKYITSVIETLLGSDRILNSNLPSLARTSVTFDASAGRYMVHLLYAPMVKRGEDVEIIEELLPLNDIELTLRIPGHVKCVKLEPEGMEIAFNVIGDAVTVKLDSFTCHQMIAFYLF